MMEYEFDELVRPIPEGNDWWSSIKQYPTKLLDQRFGYELQKADMINPEKISDVSPWPRNEEHRTQKTGHSWVKVFEEYFQVELFVPPFQAKDFVVKLEKGFLVIHGEHGEIKEGDGTTSQSSTCRSFTRRYMLPKNCEDHIKKNGIFRSEVAPSVIGVSVNRIVVKDQSKSDVSKEPAEPTEANLKENANATI